MTGDRMCGQAPLPSHLDPDAYGGEGEAGLPSRHILLQELAQAGIRPQSHGGKVQAAWLTGIQCIGKEGGKGAIPPS